MSQTGITGIDLGFDFGFGFEAQNELLHFHMPGLTHARLLQHKLFEPAANLVLEQ